MSPTGKWSFGTDTSNNAYNLAGTIELLNGQHAGDGYGVELVLDNNSGQIYSRDSQGSWYKWNNVDQWSQDISGDPRNPLPTSSLGDNTISDPVGQPQWWFYAGPNDSPCQAPGCTYSAQKVSPDPGGSSLELKSSPPWSVVIDTFTPPIRAGSTYLVSVISKGSAGVLTQEHDTSVGTTGIDMPSTMGWVQSFCKFVPKTPYQDQLKIAVYPESDVYLTHFYLGVVDSSFPAPSCHSHQ
jgi:hypothetical protein